MANNFWQRLKAKIVGGTYSEILTEAGASDYTELSPEAKLMTILNEIIDFSDPNNLKIKSNAQIGDVTVDNITVSMKASEDSVLSTKGTSVFSKIDLNNATDPSTAVSIDLNNVFNIDIVNDIGEDIYIYIGTSTQPTDADLFVPMMAKTLDGSNNITFIHEKSYGCSDNTENAKLWLYAASNPGANSYVKVVKYKY